MDIVTLILKYEMHGVVHKTFWHSSSSHQDGFFMEVRGSALPSPHGATRILQFRSYRGAIALPSAHSHTAPALGPVYWEPTA